VGEIWVVRQNGDKPALKFVIQGKMSPRVGARLCLLALHPVAAGGGFCCPFNLGVVTNNPEGVHMGFDTGYPLGESLSRESRRRRAGNDHVFTTLDKFDFLSTRYSSSFHENNKLNRLDRSSQPLSQDKAGHHPPPL